jgi:UDP-glucose 4-epimerase
MARLKVLITGGAGYVGSHVLFVVASSGHQVWSCDNYCNSSKEPLRRVREITQLTFPEFEIDIRDRQGLRNIFEDFEPDVVIHCAGLKSISASRELPLTYYDNNIVGTLRLLEAMDAAGCKNLIFSSSATVYGLPEYLPYDEKHPLNPVNTYGKTKLVAEQLISDWQGVTKDARAIFLRYFNPVGAHPSGVIGENPNGVPDNLFPYLAQVAVGLHPALRIFGGDYETFDGTGERDYVHILDLAKAHLAAINYLPKLSGTTAFNIGSGRAYSVLEIKKSFEKACGKTIPLKFEPRRLGDLPSYFATSQKAKRELGWEPTFTIDEICETAWNWQSKNPTGYS